MQHTNWPDFDASAGRELSSQAAWLAVSVVLYKPDAIMLQRISEYAGRLELLIVVDNTEHADLSDLYAGFPTVCYVPFGENKGIATALNVAAKIAISKSASWLLMLDQDSQMQPTTFSMIKAYVTNISKPTVALVSTVQVSKSSDAKLLAGGPAIKQINRAMTSGSTINLAAYLKCGAFEDKLFIDHVDNEYCLRLRKAGFQILQLSHVALNHSLGETRSLTIGKWKFQYIVHKPFRSYYYVRNGLFVAFQYWEHAPWFLNSLLFQIFKDIFKATLLQGQTILRLKMIFLGALHFCRKRYGPLTRGEYPQND
jgi:rhamnosyltransferase